MAKTLSDYIAEKASQKRSEAKSKDSQKSKRGKSGSGATLTEFLINHKNQEKSKTSTKGSNTLTEALLQKYTRKKQREENQERQEKISFQDDLKRTFSSLSQKTEEIKTKIYDLAGELADVTEQETLMSQNMGVLSEMLAQRAMLEKSVFLAVAHKFSDFPEIKISEARQPVEKKDDEEESDVEQDSENKDVPIKNDTKPPTINPPSSPTKKSKGTIKPGVSKKEDTKQSLFPYAEVMKLTLQSAGIASINVIGEFISKSGALGGFFKPYVRSIIKPFALAFGVGESLFNTLLTSPVNAAEREKNAALKDFGKTWSKFLNDDDFIKKFIDRDTSSSGENDEDPYTGEWGPLLDLIKSVEAVTHKYNAVNYGDGPGVIDGLTEMTIADAFKASETYRSKYGGSGAVGQYQFMTPISQAKDAGLNPYSDKFSPANQDKMAVWIIENKRQGKDWKERKISDEAFMKLVAAEWRGLPAAPDGKTYQDEYAGRNAAHTTWDKYKKTIEEVKGRKSFSRGGLDTDVMTPMTPFIVSGPESGFDFTVYDDIGRPYPLTLHGTELVDPMESGIKIYPIKNRSFDIEKDPLALSKRWRDIAYNTGEKSTASYSAGGSADFWKIAAISAKEDTLHPQGQADVAQSIYNRVAMGSYPGGKNIGAIITAEGQYQPTFGNVNKWKMIVDRKSAIAAVGSSKLIDMAAKSITHPTFQRESAKFVGGRTDFQGESQKKYMQSGDITRGKNHNFFGWFYDARLPKPAPIPKSISSQTRVTATSNKPTKQVVVNRTGGENVNPSVVSSSSRTQTKVSQSFDPLKFIRELVMRRSR